MASSAHHKGQVENTTSRPTRTKSRPISTESHTPQSSPESPVIQNFVHTAVFAKELTKMRVILHIQPEIAEFLRPVKTRLVFAGLSDDGEILLTRSGTDFSFVSKDRDSFLDFVFSNSTHRTPGLLVATEPIFASILDKLASSSATNPVTAEPLHEAGQLEFTQETQSLFPKWSRWLPFLQKITGFFKTRRFTVRTALVPPPVTSRYEHLLTVVSIYFTKKS